jgi:O-antigen ligase
MLVAGLQLVPLTPGQLSDVSPAADRFLVRYDLGYASVKGALNAVPAAGYRHPLSINPSGTLLGLAALAAVALLLVGTARGLGRDGLRTLAAGVVILGAALALAGIVQSGLYLHDPQKTGLVYGFWKPIFGTDPFGPFVNRNHFAGWMLMALAVGLGYFCALVGRGMRHVKPGWRNRLLWLSSADANRVILVGFGLLVMGLSLVMTLSRSGTTCFAIAIALTGLAVARRQAKRPRRAVLVAYVLFLGVLAIGWAGVDAVADRFAKADSDLAFRTAVWSDALHIYRDFPVFGSGVNTFGTAMVVYQTADPSVHFMESHNDYVQLLSEGGLLVTIPALVLLLLFIREVRRRFCDDTDDERTYWIRVGAVTGLIAIGLQEIVEFSLQMPGNAALFCTLMAIAAGTLPHRRDHGVRSA